MSDSLERLRAAGVRVTPQRRTILDAVLEIDGTHPTAEDVLRRARLSLPELSRGTVYNTLNELVRIGLLQTVEGAGPGRFDANLRRDHDHFLCRSCHGLFDIEIGGRELLEPQVPDGFGVERTRIVVEGICHRCRQSADEKGVAP